MEDADQLAGMRESEAGRVSETGNSLGDGVMAETPGTSVHQGDEEIDVVSNVQLHEKDAVSNAISAAVAMPEENTGETVEPEAGASRQTNTDSFSTVVVQQEDEAEAMDGKMAAATRTNDETVAAVTQQNDEDADECSTAAGAANPSTVHQSKRQLEGIEDAQTLSDQDCDDNAALCTRYVPLNRVMHRAKEGFVTELGISD